MTKRMRAPLLVALVIAAMMGSAYIIVDKNGSGSSHQGQPPTGVFH